MRFGKLLALLVIVYWLVCWLFGNEGERLLFCTQYAGS